jgi:hypothetical protein
MKKITWFISALIILLASFVTGCVEAETEEKRPKKMNTEWCVNVCIDDLFDNMHNNSNSWGAGSSSMNGMQQNNTFLEIKDYCESVYSKECYSLPFMKLQEAIHATSLKGATVNGD